MIEVSGIRYGCSWADDGSVLAMPLRIEFGCRGPEGTVDQMLEGEAHTYMTVEQLLALVTEMYPEGEVQLMLPCPAQVCSGLLELGYPVCLVGE
jgi:hypothetical protein